MSLSVYDSTTCLLGESAFWHKEREAFLWLDILAKTLFEKTEIGQAKKHTFSFTPSAILPSDVAQSVVLVTDQGLAVYNLASCELAWLVNYDLGVGFRANDAGLDPQGRVVFGSMEWEPSGCNGSIYRYDQQKGLIKLLDGVGIPNTFSWSADGAELYMADSYLQEMYAFDYLPAIPKKKRMLFNLASSGATPDGSTMFEDRLLNAEWDGQRVTVRSPLNGDEKGAISLPVPKPTSCTVGGKQADRLLITTASVDLTAAEKEQYPLSGQTFVAKIEDLKKAGVL